MFRRFVWRRNTGIVFGQPGTGLLVQSLDLPLFTDFHGAVTVYSQKVVNPGNGADLLSVSAHGRDESAQSNDSGIKKKPGHFGNPADILAPVFGAESQVGTQSVTDIIAIADKGSVSLAMQSLFLRMSKRGLAGTGKPRKPDCASAMAIQTFAPFAGHRGLVPDNLAHYIHKKYPQFLSDKGFLGMLPPFG